MKFTLKDVQNIAQCMALEYREKDFFKKCKIYTLDEPYGKPISKFESGPDCGHIYKVNENTVLVSYMGTHSDKGWVSNFDCDPVDMVPITKKISTDIHVHDGFQKGWKNTREQILPIIESFNNIWLTAHSRGSAIITIAAENLEFDFPNKKTAAFPFSSPRAGNDSFVEQYNKTVNYSLRLWYANDPVVDVPLEIQGYKHVNQGFHLTAPWFKPWHYLLPIFPWAHYPEHLLREIPRQLKNILPKN